MIYLSNVTRIHDLAEQWTSKGKRKKAVWWQYDDSMGKERVNEYVPMMISGEGATIYENNYIPRNICNGIIWMYFPHVKYLTKESKIHALENIWNSDLCYWRSWVINIFKIYTERNSGLADVWKWISYLTD